MQVVSGITAALSRREAATVEIAPVIPAGNPALRDIREPERLAGTGPVHGRCSAFSQSALSSGFFSAEENLRLRPSPTPSCAPALTADRRPIPTSSRWTGSPQIERERWAERGQRWTSTTRRRIDVLRDYLGTAEEIPARERTSSELLWAMPPS